MLRKLVALGKVGIEIIFPGEIIDGRDPAAAGQSHPKGIFNRLTVQTGKSAGMGKGNGAYSRVGRGAKGNGIAAEQLAFGGKLGMYFKSYDSFE